MAFKQELVGQLIKYNTLWNKASDQALSGNTQGVINHQKG
jgi:hypothetical protein